MNLVKLKDVRPVLFGLSTLLVVFFHTYDMEFSFDILNVIRGSGDIGVEIFLFLSGLGLFQSMKSSHSLKAFYKRRFLRIMPAVVITALIKQLFLSKATVTQKIVNLTIMLFLRVGWYFGFIVILYILFPVIYKFTVKYREKFILLLTVMDVLGCLILSRINMEFYLYTSLMLTRIPIFLAGTLFGLYVSEDLKIPRKLVIIDYIILVIACIALVYFHGFPFYPFLKPVIYYFLSVSLILAVANKNIFSLFSNAEKGLAWIGNYSMEIYLVYEAIWSLCYQHIKAHISNLWIYFGMIFGLTIISAIILKYLAKKIADFINARVSF